ncbi:glycerol dehydrogenase [Rhizobium sp. TRM95796]|uniref:glycerol dehydrogenase n=1 Tax=Rhizobium sp. TRM95796 TaxID=2979862 RepID=UPI0021E84590|nr:glycerol dehydrogenase [Rhizobium sp. TRM95796]MCV3767772.1 glycerol dehydrogenase [Rhizobium sp. TRM95796]
MSLRIFGGPHRYLQGPGALDELGRLARPFGTNPAIIADAFVLDLLKDRLETLLAAEGLTPIVLPFSGEITYPAIDALEAALSGQRPSLAIGIGGGKSLDAAKGLARKLGLDVITVPTIASNDSPTSSAIAMYDDHHVMISVDRLARSPEAVIVDTTLIARAPRHFLLAGIGDAVAKKFEAEGCLNGSGVTPFGTRPLVSAAVIADACYQTLRRSAQTAMVDLDAGRMTQALEDTIEATILMSGLGFENGGLSLAHSLTRGLVKARGAKDAIHGQHVAWGALVQLAAEGRRGELQSLVAFNGSIGLATSLGDLGMSEPTKAEIEDLARWTMTAPHLGNMPNPVSVETIMLAIEHVEELAHHMDRRGPSRDRAVAG